MGDLDVTGELTITGAGARTTSVARRGCAVRRPNLRYPDGRDRDHNRPHHNRR
jgi:hypothetical protein